MKLLYALFVLSLLLFPVWAPAQTTGAVDPTVIGNPGPVTVPKYERAILNGAISPNVPANSRELCPNGRGLQQNETSIVVSGDVVVVAFNDARGGPSACPDDHAAVGWAYSLDAGKTFTDGGGLPFPRDFNNGDPWLGVSPDGTTFYLTGLWRGFQGLGFYRGGVVNNQLVWSDPVIVSFPAGNPFMDKEAFAVDPNSGTIYLCYTDFRDGTKIKATRSLDGGDTWLDPVAVSNGGSQGSFPAIDGLGTVYVAHQQGGMMRITRSTDLGDSFQQVAVFPFRTRGVPAMDRSSDFPQVAVDTSGGDRDGWVYVVWHSISDENVIRPYITHSEDGGETWTDPIPVNTDDTDAEHWWPSVSVDALGNVNVVFLDRRLNPGTALTDLFYAQSTDGGYSFIDMRASDVSGDWRGIRYDPGFTYAGDYIRAISSGTSVYAAWTDARNGDPDIYFTRIETGK